MELRDRLSRHAVLAEVFCQADESVGEAQLRLEEAQAQRVRMLAALAITVGSDSATARLIGLSDRQVRVARRTVGNHDARTVAEQLLTEHQSGTPTQDRDTEGEAGAAQTGGRGAVGHAPGIPPQTPPHAAWPPPPAGPASHPGHPGHPGHASPLPQAGPPSRAPHQHPWHTAEDTLLQAWLAGESVRSLAAQLNRSTDEVLARAQALSVAEAYAMEDPDLSDGLCDEPDHGHHQPVTDFASGASRRGRHRRLHALNPDDIPAPPAPAPGNPYADNQWRPSAWDYHVTSSA